MGQERSKGLYVLGYHLLAGMILVIPALMNFAPLVYSDSGTYIVSSRTLVPPIDRPIGYGLIIRAVTWQSTLWTVVFFQGMVASWLISRTMCTLFPGLRNGWRTHIIILALLLALSGLPWFASQLMPDVLTGMLPLCVFLILFGRRLHAMEVLLLWVLLFFFTITHLSHPLIMLALGAFCSIHFLKGAARRVLAPKGAAALVGLFLVPVLALLFIMGSNAREGRGFVLSPTSSLFMAGKLIESGVMYTYLDRHCADRPNFLCAHKLELNKGGMHYVWNDDAPTRQGLGLVESSDRLRPVVEDILREPDMWPMLAWTSLLSTVLQLAAVDLGVDVYAYGEHTAPWYPIADNYRHEYPLYMESVQQRNSWGLGYLKPILLWVLLFACVLITVRWPPRRQLRWWAFIMIMVLATIANAAATGAVANIYDRLQSRMTWLLVLAAILLLARHIPAMRNLLMMRQHTGNAWRTRD